MGSSRLDDLVRELDAGPLPAYLVEALARAPGSGPELARAYAALEEHLADLGDGRRFTRAHLRGIVRTRLPALAAAWPLLFAAPEEQERRARALLDELIGGDAGAFEARVGAGEAARRIAAFLDELAGVCPGLDVIAADLLPARFLDADRAPRVASRRRERAWAERLAALRRVHDEVAARVESLERKAASPSSPSLLLGAVTSALELTGEGLVMLDREGTVVGSSRAALAMFGRAEPEIVGRPLGELFPGGRAAETLSRFVAGDRPGAVGDRLVVDARRRDGTTFPARVRAVEAGGGFTLVVRDLTEERAAAARLRLQAAAVHGSAEAIAVADAAGKIEWVNPAFELLTGHAAADVVGRPLAEVCGVALDEAATSWRGERVNWRADGSPYDARIALAPVRDDAGRVTHVVVHLEDVTAQRRSAAALARSEASLRALIEGVPDFLLVVRGGLIIFGNAAAATALGLGGRTGLIGRGLTDLHAISPGERFALVGAAAALERDGAPLPAREIRITPTGGATLVVELVGVRVTFDGAPAAVLVGRDTSERRRLQERLAVADRLVALGTLAAGVAHEINNPLTYALMNVEIIADSLDMSAQGSTPRGTAPQRLASTARETLEGLERIRRIVRDLGLFSRPDSGAEALVDLRGVLDSAADLVAGQLRSRASVVRDYQPMPLVRATEARLVQVFVNLLTNAAQAIPPGNAAGNTVEIRAGTDAQGRAEITVHDTGPGIPPELRQRVFDPFFTTRDVGEGAGLGLSICHQLVGGLGGAIEIDPATQHGTTVRVTLPAAAAGSGKLPAARTTSGRTVV